MLKENKSCYGAVLFESVNPIELENKLEQLSHIAIVSF
jgi:hypothetical protein